MPNQSVSVHGPHRIPTAPTLGMATVAMDTPGRGPAQPSRTSCRPVTQHLAHLESGVGQPKPGSPASGRGDPLAPLRVGTPHGKQASRPLTNPMLCGGGSWRRALAQDSGVDTEVVQGVGALVVKGGGVGGVASASKEVSE